MTKVSPRGGRMLGVRWARQASCTVAACLVVGLAGCSVPGRPAPRITRSPAPSGMTSSALPTPLASSAPLGALPLSCPGPRATPKAAGISRRVLAAVSPAVGVGAVRVAGPIAGEEFVSLLQDQPMVHGWPVKALWLVRQGTKPPPVLSGVDLSGPEPVWFSVLTISTHPKLPWRDSNAASGPADGWSQFASEMIFPSAGCYLVSAKWSGGSWSVTVGVGL